MAAPLRIALRLALRLGIFAFALCLALLLCDRLVVWFDIRGISYPAETLRYRQDATDLVLVDSEGNLDLDGVLFRHKPGVEVSFRHFDLKVNKLGFRGPEITVEKPEDTCRILVLGDSVAFGWGVDDEVTFLRLLENRLNGALGDGRRYEVVNTGHPMYDSMQELSVLRDRGLALDPDVVLLVYVVNDIDPTREVAEQFLKVQEAARTGTTSDLPQPPPPSLFDRVGSVLPGLHAALGPMFAPSFDPDEVARYRPEKTEDGSDKPGWIRSKKALLEMRDLCNSKEIPFLVLDHTLPRVESLPGFCGEHGIALRDLQFTEEERARPIYNSATDPHNNALGQQLLLGKLIDALRDVDIVPGLKKTAD